MRYRLCSRCLLLGMVVCCFGARAVAVDNSPPPILQWFDSSYETMINRTADVFMAGYGAVWTPPPGRGDTGDHSVGYDVYDRFDLGRWDQPTLYGTETGLQRTATMFHRAAFDLHVDFVLNHNGYSGTGDAAERAAFLEAGAYPAFFLEHGGDVDGDFHSAFASGDLDGRLAGLIDIDHSKNYQAIRNPVPGFENNLPAGSVPLYGRLANVARESNRRFYPDVGHETIYVFDPKTGEGDIPIHQFNFDDPMAGDPVEENATGYLMRNAQWLVQVIGVDGLRIDAAKHVEGFVLDYIDRAVYRANPRRLLDGSTKHVFSYGEVFDSDPGKLLSYVRKDIDPGNPGVVGGNRDVLDYSLYFAMKENLEQHGTPGVWQNIRDASLDHRDDGMHNGSAGVKFVHNHDVFKPYKLSDVAHAYVLMMPGEAAVYFNGKEFGDNRDFPKEGRGDALSVGGSSPLTKLLDARATHGRGNYAERWIDDQGIFIFERVSSAVIGLSNRGDGGYDTRYPEVGFAPGTFLVELSGNAGDPLIDPSDDIPEVLTVFQDGSDGRNKIEMKIPRNFNHLGEEHNRGYVVYGLPTPQAADGLELLGVETILPGQTDPSSDYENGINRQTDLHVVTGDALEVRLQTEEVRLLGLDELRDVWADGDNALLKLDGGLDINGNGYVDHTTPGSVAYGFESFADKSSPLIGPEGIDGLRGDGQFLQTIDVTALEEGVHLLEARTFRHRTDGGPAVFSSFKKAIYVDRLPPESGIHELRAVNSPGDTDVLVESLDFTGDAVHVFLNLPESVTETEIYEMAALGEGASQQMDVNLFKRYFEGIGAGNNVLTLVTFEPTGNSNVQRLTGQWVDGRGSGLGDLDHDGQYQPADMAFSDFGFERVLYSQNAEFNPAGDVNADGRVDNLDLYALDAALQAAGAPQATLDAYGEMLLRRGDFTGDFGTNPWDIDELYGRFDSTDWFDDLSVDGTTDQDDIDILVRIILGAEYGDVNLDTGIDIADLQLLHDSWEELGGWASGDLTGDGFVGPADLELVELYWNSTQDFDQAFNQVFIIPEPSSILLLSIGALLACLLRRRLSEVFVGGDSRRRSR